MTITDRRGYTLVEVLVAMAVLGIITVGLARFYIRLTEATQYTSSYTTINENLSLAGNQIAHRLRALANNNDLQDRSVYEFVGIDGSDGSFSNQPQTPHNNLTTNPNEHSDRLHFHARLGSDQIDHSTALKSNRVYYAYWINGEDSPKPKTGLTDRWGILERSKKHTIGETLPRYGTDDELTPVLDLNQSNTGHSNVGILAFSVDFLKFRFWDAKTGDWKENWNTVDPGKFPTTDDRFPSAVQILIRGYAKRANGSNITNLVTPVWYKTTVSLTTTD
ncbi:MAG: type II secretion system protein J [bacterium]